MPRRGRGPWYGYRVTALESKRARGRVPGAGRKTSGRSPLRLAPRLTPSARDWGIWPLRQSESRRRGHHRSTDRKGSQRSARRAHHGILGPSSGHLPPPRRAGVPDSVRRGEVEVASGELKSTDRSELRAGTVLPEPGRATGHSLISLVAGWVPAGRTRRALGQIVRGAHDAAREIVFLTRTFRRLRDLDLLIIAGSNQFLDNFGGPWAFPYTLLKWSIVCRLAGCRLFFVSVGAGPLDAALSRTMVRPACRWRTTCRFATWGRAGSSSEISHLQTGQSIPI